MAKFGTVNFSEVASNKTLRMDAEFWLSKKEGLFDDDRAFSVVDIPGATFYVLPDGFPPYHISGFEKLQIIASNDYTLRLLMPIRKPSKLEQILLDHSSEKYSVISVIGKGSAELKSGDFIKKLTLSEMERVVQCLKK